MSIIAGCHFGRSVTGLLWLVVICLGSVQAQLPVVEKGEVTARLDAWANGFPVNTWVNDAGNEFRFGPTNMVAVPGSPGTFAVSTHGGLAYVVTSAGEIQDTPLLDFNTEASPSYSPGFAATPIQGFTSIAYHPGFADSESPGYGRFYTLESEDVSAAPVVDFADSVVGANHHHEVVYEYTLSDSTLTVCDVECARTKRALMRIEQPGLHHNLGDLVFGQDGMLYISSGDGDNTGNHRDVAISDNSQLLTNVFGKILRIDPLGSNSANGMYGVPADNPFVDGPAEALDEIYAYGLRNPYRLALDAETGELYTSETGQLNIESVYRIQRGANYGWNLLEGSFLYDKGDQATVFPDEDANGNGIGDFAEQNGFERPVLEFDHQSGLAIIGSVLYRGSAFPELAGKFIFADHFGKLFYGDPDTGLINEFRLTDDSAAIPSLVFSINEDANGELYVLGVSGRGENADGHILRLRPDPLRGDFDKDGDLDVDDVEALMQSIAAGDERVEFDLNGDQRYDAEDLGFWVHELKNTYFGDADLNGEFNSSDLVEVWKVGEYEDDISRNSTWAEGDWNLDLDFSSSDLVAVFWDGGYELGPRPAQGVPEPSGFLLLLIGIVVLNRTRL